MNSTDSVEDDAAKGERATAGAGSSASTAGEKAADRGTGTNGAADDRPWMDRQRGTSERARQLLERLTLAQKMAQVSCYLPSDIANTSEMSDTYPDGVGHVSTLEARSAKNIQEVVEFQRRVQQEAMRASGHDIPAIFHMEGVCGALLPGATSFPNGLARGASWDVDLEEHIGKIVARQERAFGITQTLAPVLDVARDPRMGRVGEAYSEDATLVAALGTGFARGVQSEDSFGRRSESVAKHFAGSHHAEGGIHGAHAEIPERLLQEVYLKPFQAAISMAGLRGVMPCYNSVGGEPASSSSYLLGTLLREQMGFDGVVVSDYGAIGNLHTVQHVAASMADAGLMAMTAGVDAEFHFPQGFSSDLAARFAEGTADIGVLDRAVLRVLEAKVRMGLFEHPFAVHRDVVELANDEESNAEVSLRSAAESLVLLRNDGILPLQTPMPVVAVIGPHAVTARYFFGGYTRYSMAEGMLAARASMAGLAGGDADHGPIETIPGTSIEASDGFEYEELLETQKPGVKSLVDELRSRMPATDVRWASGYPIAGDDETGFDRALAVAASADVVLVTLGGKHGTASIATTGEGLDSTNVNLPACQESFIKKVAQLGKPVIGIHLDGRPISSDAADANLSAIVEAWSPAEWGARAIVDMLTGEVTPSGRLPISVARNAGQVAIYYNHPYGSAWHQGESVGLPDYVDSPHTPRYYFGHGLSYTTFDYSEMSLSTAAVDPDGQVIARVSVTNSGNRRGTEVVQLYLTDQYASTSRPVLELAGFRRVTLDPDESSTLEFTIKMSQLALLDRDMNWRVEAGEIEISVGASSVDLRSKATISILRDAIVDPRSRGLFVT